MSGFKINKKDYKRSLKGISRPLKPTKIKDISRQSIRLKDLIEYATSQNKSITELTSDEIAMFQ